MKEEVLLEPTSFLAAHTAHAISHTLVTPGTRNPFAITSLDVPRKVHQRHSFAALRWKMQFGRAHFPLTQALAPIDALLLAREPILIAAAPLEHELDAFSDLGIKVISGVGSGDAAREANVFRETADEAWRNLNIRVPGNG